MAIGTAATGMETLPPQMIRLRMSRPWPSVPRMKPGVKGGERRLALSTTSFGPYGLIHGAATAIRIAASRTIVPIIASRSLTTAASARAISERCSPSRAASAAVSGAAAIPGSLSALTARLRRGTAGSWPRSSRRRPG